MRADLALGRAYIEAKKLHVEIRFVEDNFSPDVYEDDSIILLTLS